MTRVGGDWLEARGTQQIMRMLLDGGHRALAVGGCVRNALLGVPVSDVDIATDARPERVIALAEAADVRAVPTGMAHGTVTLVADGAGFEVTTFRADVATDGRRAVVRFATDVIEDAQRRDFTMNALYSEADGTLVDPLGALPDVTARRLRFVGDPGRRIREDYLRILRFFRFSAWYADPTHGMDAEALAAISATLDGLSQLSRERVGAEVVKLLSAPDPAPAVAAMARTGALAATLPGAAAEPLAPLVHLETRLGIAADPLRRLAVLGLRDDADLRLPKRAQRRLAAIRDAVDSGDGPAILGYRTGKDVARDALLIRAASAGTELPADALAEAARGAAASFPVRPRDLMPDFEGPALGARLAELEARWIASDFTLDRAALLRR